MRKPPRLAWIAGTLMMSALPALADAVDDANALFRKGQASQALAAVDTFLKSNPQDTRGRFLRALILAEQNRSDEAIAALRALNEDRPELPEPYNNLAVLYAAQGRYEDARRVLETAILAHPGYALAHENLGDVFARLAAQAYERASKLDAKASGVRAKLKLMEQLLEKK
jgi:Flp pilus assembly protein TadD